MRIRRVFKSSRGGYLLMDALLGMALLAVLLGGLASLRDHQARTLEFAMARLVAAEAGNGLTLISAAASAAASTPASAVASASAAAGDTAGTAAGTAAGTVDIAHSSSPDSLKWKNLLTPRLSSMSFGLDSKVIVQNPGPYRITTEVTYFVRGKPRRELVEGLVHVP